MYMDQRDKREPRSGEMAAAAQEIADAFVEFESSGPDTFSSELRHLANKKLIDEARAQGRTIPSGACEREFEMVHNPLMDLSARFLEIRVGYSLRQQQLWQAAEIDRSSRGTDLVTECRREAEFINLVAGHIELGCSAERYQRNSDLAVTHFREAYDRCKERLGDRHLLTQRLAQKLEIR